MNNSKLSKNHQSNSYTEIKVNELQCDYINNNESNAVQKLKKTLHKRFIIQFICVLFFCIFLAYLLYISLTSNATLFNTEVILVFIATVSFLGLLLYIGKQLLLTFKNSCEKVQHGLVKSKYVLTDYSNDNRNENFYINVIFPDTNTFVKNVICSKSIYNVLNEGNNVLVVSFDNKTAYAISL